MNPSIRTPSKWDLLLSAKPIPVQEHLLVECSRLFANDLSQWPLPMVESDADTAALVASTPVRPGPIVFREAFQLARWELEHNFEAQDEYHRNRRWQEAGISPPERPLLMLIGRFIEEQLLSLAEATQGRIKRPALLRLLDLTETDVMKRLS